MLALRSSTIFLLLAIVCSHSRHSLFIALTCCFIFMTFSDQSFSQPSFHPRGSFRILFFFVLEVLVAIETPWWLHMQWLSLAATVAIAMPVGQGFNENLLRKKESALQFSRWDQLGVVSHVGSKGYWKGNVVCPQSQWEVCHQILHSPCLTLNSHFRDAKINSC